MNDTRSHRLERYPTDTSPTVSVSEIAFFSGLLGEVFFGRPEPFPHYVGKKSVPNALGFSHSRMLGLTPNAFTVAGRHLLDAHMHTQLLGCMERPSVGSVVRFVDRKGTPS